MPGFGPAFEGLLLGGRGFAVFGAGEEARVGGVVEGAEHAADVFEGGVLEAGLGEGGGGLAFEVDDDEVAARVEDLAEVVVAVDAGAQGVELMVYQGLEADGDVILALHDGPGFFSGKLGERLEAALQEV